MNWMTSKDYNRLFDLVSNGDMIPCRCLGSERWQHFDFCEKDRRSFVEECKRQMVEFIDPRIYQPKYPLWSRVTLAGDIRALITAVQFSASVLYRVEWFAKGNKETQWMLEREIDEFGKNE